MGHLGSVLSPLESNYTSGHSFRSHHHRFVTIRYLPSSTGSCRWFQPYSLGAVHTQARQCNPDSLAALDSNHIHNGLCATGNSHHGSASRTHLSLSRPSRSRPSLQRHIGSLATPFCYLSTHSRRSSLLAA